MPSPCLVVSSRIMALVVLGHSASFSLTRAPILVSQPSIVVAEQGTTANAYARLVLILLSMILITWRGVAHDERSASRRSWSFVVMALSCGRQSSEAVA